MKIISTFRNKRAKTTFADCPANKQGRTAVEVSTFKSSRGTLVTMFQWGLLEEGEGYQSFSFVIHGDEWGVLHEETKRATDKAIQKQHAEQVDIFMKRNGWEVQP